MRVAPELTASVGDLVKTVQLDPLVSRLWAGLCVHSQSAVSDVWLMLKNEHVGLSMFLAHPEHPYTRVTRSRVTVLSALMAFGLMALFAGSSTSESANTILSLVVGIAVQTFYDSTLKFAATCPCVQEGVPSCIKSCFMAIGSCFMCAQGLIMLVMLLVGIIVLATEPNKDSYADDYDPDFGAATLNWIYSKASSLFVTTLFTSMVMIVRKRREQMKPRKSDEHYREKMKKWTSKRPPSLVMRLLFCCCIACFPSKPPISKIWDRFHGADKEMDDLPANAPLYDIDINFTVFGFYKHELFTIKAPESRKFKPAAETTSQEVPAQASDPNSSSQSMEGKVVAVQTGPGAGAQTNAARVVNTVGQGDLTQGTSETPDVLPQGAVQPLSQDPNVVDVEAQSVVQG